MSATHISSAHVLFGEELLSFFFLLNLFGRRVKFDIIVPKRKYVYHSSHISSRLSHMSLLVREFDAGWRVKRGKSEGRLMVES